MTQPSLTTLLERRATFLAFVERRVGDRALAEDILQSAYMRAMEAQPPAEEMSSVAWFYSVLRHAVIDFYRRRATESKMLDAWAREFDGEPSVPDPSTQTFICGCIAHVLPNLKPSYAELLRDVDLGESSLTAFAKAHAISAGNAAVRAHRARQALRAELARFCGACSLHACLNCDCKIPAAHAATA